MKYSTVNEIELKKFEKLSADWWNYKGVFKQLHLMNPLRIKFIKKNLKKHYNLKEGLNLFQGLKILDVGCGGGLLSLPMSRLGAKVTGIDIGNKNIEIARNAAKLENLDIDFKCIDIIDLAQKKEQFDALLCFEVIEHVDNLNSFLESVSKIVKPNGLVLMSTINQTYKAYVLAIIFAEYITKFLPIGTHDYKKFIAPAGLNKILVENNLKLNDLQGMTFNPIKKKWIFSENLEVNYLLCATKS